MILGIAQMAVLATTGLDNTQSCPYRLYGGERENNVYIQIEIFRWQYSRGYSQQRYHNIAGNTN